MSDKEIKCETFVQIETAHSNAVHPLTYVNVTYMYSMYTGGKCFIHIYVYSYVGNYIHM